MIKWYQYVITALLLGLSVTIFGVSMWRPTRDGFAPLIWPDYVCPVLALLGLVAMTYPYFIGHLSTPRFFLVLIPTGLLFGSSAWITERLFYDMHWKWGLGGLFLVLAAIGTSFYGIGSVLIKIVIGYIKRSNKASSANSLHASRSTLG